jgi:DNA-3-methyladenine glycosylase II
MSVQPSFSITVETAIAYLRDIDPIMGTVIERVGPCTLAPDPHIFDALVDAIISQQISVKAADAIMARVRAALPNSEVTPEHMAELDFETLRSLGLSTQKANYMRNLVEHITSGALQLDLLPNLSDEEVITQLTAVKGIGRWTAEMILIFSLARPDVLPVDDLGLLEGARTAYALLERPKPKELLARGELWRPYRTFATWYLWAVRRLATNDERARTRIVSL